MSARASGSLLEQSLKDLMVEWQQCRASWNDGKAREFEHDYLEPIPAMVNQVRPVIEDIDVLLRKLRNECE
jgi:hypothetical protein